MKGFWNLDSNGRLHERSESGGTNPLRTGPSNAGRLLNVRQHDGRVIVEAENGTYEKLSGTWRKLTR